jgi:hypothetical protein
VSFAYVVRIAFDDEAAVGRYLPWLREHVEHVCEAGAQRAEIVLLDGEAAIEARYVFASRAAFERYENEEAPRLRREGKDEIARLGVQAAFTRTTGEIVTRRGHVA